MSQLVALAILLSILGCGAIYEGTKADVNQFPYAVMIYAPASYGAGVLISDRHVLTAAHVLKDIFENETVGVFGGTNDLNNEADGVFMESSKFFIHENFSMPSAVNDIGIIELPERINVSESLKPIAISARTKVDLDTEDFEVVLSGWGHVAFNQSTDFLQFATMRLIALRECLKYREFYTEAITRGNICSMRLRGMPCNGDSGGAIVSRMTGKVIGIASFGKDGDDEILSNCDTNVPLVSTRISSYIDWIREKTGLEIDDDGADENVVYSDLD